MLTLRAVFLYLDRTHVTQMAGVRSLWDMGLQLFRRSLVGAEVGAVGAGAAGTGTTGVGTLNPKP